MKTETEKAQRYKASFIINTAAGSLMLASALAAYIAELLHPALLGKIAFGFLVPSEICFFVASLHYATYLKLSE